MNCVTLRDLRKGHLSEFTHPLLTTLYASSPLGVFHRFTIKNRIISDLDHVPREFDNHIISNILMSDFAPIPTEPMHKVDS